MVRDLLKYNPVVTFAVWDEWSTLKYICSGLEMASRSFYLICGWSGISS